MTKVNYYYLPVLWSRWTISAPPAVPPGAACPGAVEASSAVAAFAAPTVPQSAEPASAPVTARPHPRRMRSDGTEAGQDHDRDEDDD